MTKPFRYDDIKPIAATPERIAAVLAELEARDFEDSMLRTVARTLEPQQIRVEHECYSVDQLTSHVAVASLVRNLRARQELTGGLDVRDLPRLLMHGWEALGIRAWYVPPFGAGYDHHLARSLLEHALVSWREQGAKRVEILPLLEHSAEPGDIDAACQQAAALVESYASHLWLHKERSAFPETGAPAVKVQLLRPDSGRLVELLRGAAVGEAIEDPERLDEDVVEVRSPPGTRDALVLRIGWPPDENVVTVCRLPPEICKPVVSFWIEPALRG